MIPVIIITLCRYEHLKRCIESLQNNTLANKTSLYIGLDYPAREEHREGYEKICSFLEQGIQGFEGVTVIRHKKNVGPSLNHKRIKEVVFQKYDSYIFVEDDCVFSPNYLEYMNKVSLKHINDERCIGIMGYGYPLKIYQSSSVYYKNSYYLAATAYAISRDKDYLLEHEVSMHNFLRFYADSKKMKQLRKVSPNQYCNFVKAMLGYTGDLIKDEEIWHNDLAFGLYQFFEGYYSFFPTLSKVRNTGYDGSGVNCSMLNIEGNTYYFRNYDYMQQNIDEDKEIHDLVLIDDTKDVEKDLRLFFTISFFEKIKTDLAYWVSRCIGVEIMRKVISRIYKGKEI